MTTTLKAKCPTCGRPVRLPRFAVAVTVVRRSCRCGSRWAIKVEPLKCRIEGMSIHAATFSPMKKTLDTTSSLG